jgi:hypothetical protein
MVGIRLSDHIQPFWPDPVRWLKIRLVWPDSGQIGRRKLGGPDFGEGGRIPSPDSSDINRMLSDSDIGNISIVVGYLNVNVDCVV